MCVCVCVCVFIDAACKTGEVTVREGDSKAEGIVEVCVDGEYWNVCDDSWDNASSEVVCRNLADVQYNGAYSQSFSAQTNV